MIRDSSVTAISEGEKQGSSRKRSDHFDQAPLGGLEVDRRGIRENSLLLRLPASYLGSKGARLPNDPRKTLGLGNITSFLATNQEAKKNHKTGLPAVRSLGRRNPL